jgi:hypothetical protein
MQLVLKQATFVLAKRIFGFHVECVDTADGGSAREVPLPSHAHGMRQSVCSSEKGSGKMFTQKGEPAFC